MGTSLEQRLRGIGIEMSPPVTPGANFAATKRVGNLLYVSGQVPVSGGVDRYVGKLGADLSLEDGQAAARLCAINVLSQVNQAVGGDFDQVLGCVRLGGFVNAAPDFKDHPKVLNGASDLVIAILGDAGRHTRAAVGCNSLPRNVAVEVDAIFELADR
ncbi:RidA family protein [Burkholderia sp. Bp9143]|uniref:RidA family protein n=1 Tax=Burkholderia sp. Bp9143 TaxID=2184574 RepID=UPI000F59797B|nr:RidA family protein [Burkholderia sp. Bp9143]RQR35481.1 RidA family protein [Burkholderia sp. Bp9143]